MNFDGKKIGIWGYGITGKAALDFFSQFDCTILVIDKNEKVYTKIQEINNLERKSIEFYLQKENELIESKIFSSLDFILPSAGIDIRDYYTTHKEKFIFEIDLFQLLWKKPIIAITGTIGKTSSVHYLSQILKNYGLAIATGGNIGKASLELLQSYNKNNIALLELSSFQLEHCTQLHPTIAILTNFYPNHLDRHETEAEYFEAKWNIFNSQKKNEYAIAPIENYETINKKIQDNKIESKFCFFSIKKPSKIILENPNITLFYLQKSWIIMHQNGSSRQLIKLNDLPPITFVSNWIIISATIHLLGLPVEKLKEFTSNLNPLEHRIEKVASMNGIVFYNDSKATTPQATLSAVKKLEGRPILLFIGGLSKGVDRSTMFFQLQKKVKKIYCFGKEAEELAQFCANNNIPFAKSSQLDDLFKIALKDAKKNDQILFSPAGSSYDLFENYEKRGIYFKELVTKTII